MIKNHRTRHQYIFNLSKYENLVNIRTMPTKSGQQNILWFMKLQHTFDAWMVVTSLNVNPMLHFDLNQLMMLIQRFSISWPFQHPSIPCKFRNLWIEYCDTWYLTDTEALNPCLWKCARISQRIAAACHDAFRANWHPFRENAKCISREKEWHTTRIEPFIAPWNTVSGTTIRSRWMAHDSTKGCYFYSMVGVESKRMEVLYNLFFLFHQDIIFTRVL